MKLIKIWNNKKAILKGFFNFLIRKPKVELIAHKRMSICKRCDHYDLTGKGCEVPGTTPCCDKRLPHGCGCSLNIKTRSMGSSCPLPVPKWPAEK